MCLLQSEKELQSGGEIKELADAADKLSKRLVKDTTAWTNKKENLEADQATCQQACLSSAAGIGSLSGSQGPCPCYSNLVFIWLQREQM